MKGKIYTVDVTKSLGKALDAAGFGDDSNEELDITKAGVWDIMDALSGKDNSKFTVAQAKVEYKKRMGEH